METYDVGIPCRDGKYRGRTFEELDTYMRLCFPEDSNGFETIGKEWNRWTEWEPGIRNGEQPEYRHSFSIESWDVVVQIYFRKHILFQGESKAVLKRGFYVAGKGRYVTSSKIRKLYR